MMQTCALTDGFVRKGIIASTYGQVSVNATRCRGVQRGQRNVGVVSLYRIAEALSMSLSELFA
jgi:hypothetical protein